MGGSTVNRFTYTLDRVGLRTGLRETLGSQTKLITYTYDGLQRLTSALESPGSVYTSTYDLAGNRTFAQRDNQVLDLVQYLPTDQRNDWAYDLAGNVIHDDTEGYTQYSYDALNRMTTQVTMGVTTTHTYNGDSVLVAQTANGTTTYMCRTSPPSYLLTNPETCARGFSTVFCGYYRSVQTWLRIN